MRSTLADLRYAAREFGRRPALALTAILSLALGIGTTTAVFSVVYGVLLNPFPYVGADRMMQLALMDPAGRFRYPGMSGAQLIVTWVPTNSFASESVIEMNSGTSGDQPVVRLNFISPECFPVLNIPVRQGRVWDRDETMRGTALAVINETMARQYWPNGNAIGRQFRIPNLGAAPPYSPASADAGGWVRIVGVVADARNDGLRSPIRPAAYVPYSLKLRMFTQILVRTHGPPLTTLRDIRAEIVRVDREQQVMRVRDLQGWITNLPEYPQQRLVANLFGIFSTLALALSAVGLYSVVSYGVAARTNEFGIRMALGANAGDVVRMVLSGTSRNVGAGLLAGALLCFGFDTVASQWLMESSRDPLAALRHE